MCEKKKNNRADTSVSCRNCNSLLHKKCCRLKQAELFDLKRNEVCFVWECSNFMKDKSPFSSVDYIVRSLTQTYHVNSKK